jgi:hypothetical protein
MSCTACHREIAESQAGYAVTALGGVFHAECFVCCDCGNKLFSISAFFEKNGRPQCRDCKNKKGPKCHTCKKEIVELDHVVYFGMHFCAAKCMLCHKCKKPCKEGEYCEDEGQLYHLNCLA